MADTFHCEWGAGVGPERVLLENREIAAVAEALAGMPEHRRTVFLVSRADGFENTVDVRF